mmetsp:Transcript_8702/g.21083  ORF Transcript_8702/g.21083 Transcript_8702/m.21083 type:complete len:844 (-) Transcript_8702:203-2734(-)
MSSWLNSLFFKKVYTFPNAQEVEEVKEIAEGGFAYVSICKDSKTGDQYALKKMICQDKKSLDMANQEVAILASLPEHKNIIRFYQSALIELATGGGPVKKEIVMLLEYCPGGTLLDWILSRGSQMRVEVDILKPFQDAAEAVFTLHSHKPPVVHQDLKVENVLMGSDGNWKLCDFGSWTSERIDLKQASRQEIMRRQDHYEQHVTMMYRPPEMADLYQKEVLHVQIDQWQLGCILYTLMFYKQPFQDCTAPLAIAHAGYELPADFVPGETYSENLETVLHWLLAKSPNSRLDSRNLVRILWEWEGNPCLNPSEDSNTLVVQPPKEVYAQKKEKRRKCIDRSQNLQGAIYNPVAVLNLVESKKEEKEQAEAATAAGTIENTLSNTILTTIGMKPAVEKTALEKAVEKKRGVAAGKVTGSVEKHFSPRDDGVQGGGGASAASSTTAGGAATTSSSSSKKQLALDAADEMQKFRTKAVGPRTAPVVQRAGAANAKKTASGAPLAAATTAQLQLKKADEADAKVVDFLAMDTHETSAGGESSSGDNSGSKDSWVADFGGGNVAEAVDPFGAGGPSAQQISSGLDDAMLLGIGLSAAAPTTSACASASASSSKIIEGGLPQTTTAQAAGGRRDDIADLFSSLGGAGGTSAPSSAAPTFLGEGAGGTGPTTTTARLTSSGVVTGASTSQNNFYALSRVDSLADEIEKDTASRKLRNDNLFSDLTPIRSLSPASREDVKNGGPATSSSASTSTGAKSKSPSNKEDRTTSADLFAPAARGGGPGARGAVTMTTTAAGMVTPSPPPRGPDPFAPLSSGTKDPFQVDFFSSTATGAKEETNSDKLFDDIDMFK